MTTPISWLNVSKAISWYESLGYKYVEMPWTASEEAVRSTLPLDKRPCSLVVGESPVSLRYDSGFKGVCLLGSAEQGFIDMMLEGRLDPGHYVAATPCFRDDEVDLLHQQTFFKVELLRIPRAPSRGQPSTHPAKLAFREIILDALDFMSSLTDKPLVPVDVSKTQTDLELNGIEVGSYGTRKCTIEGKRLQWVYGTGLAEPRFSIAERQAPAP